MSGSITLEHGLMVFLVVMFLIPCGIIILVSQEAAYFPVSGEPVVDAANLTGITITSVKATHWNLTGSSGGKTYVLADTNGNTLTLSTQTFESAEARDAAIRLYNSHPVGRGKPVSSLHIVGQQLVYANPANSPILEKIVPVLKEKARAVPTGT
ncbi:hypothetical protein [Methanoregula sp.]|uniref:hypothetical protein n=1 Tax=Methanoregula sp. TaxID=2052170 RepID=UPI0035636FBA